MYQIINTKQNIHVSTVYLISNKKLRYQIFLTVKNDARAWHQRGGKCSRVEWKGQTSTINFSGILKVAYGQHGHREYFCNGRGTVPVNKEHLTGTVPVNKEHLTGTVPVIKKHIRGTLKN